MLAVSSTFYIISSFAGGWLSDHAGQRWVTLTGLILRGIGILIYPYGVLNAGWILPAAILTGLGNGIYIPAAKAGIATLAELKERRTVFSLRGIAANIGTTLGPLLGGYLFARSIFWLFTVSTVLYVGLGIVHALLLPAKIKTDTSATEIMRKAAAPRMYVVFKDSRYLMYTVISILIWLLYAQLTFSVPLRITYLHMGSAAIGWIWALSSILIIAFQAGLTKRAAGHSPLRLLAWGTLLFAVGFGTISLSRGFWSLLASVLLITVGEMLVMPTIDSTVALFATEHTAGLYYGVASVAFGIGDALGNYLGGWVMNTVNQGMPAGFPWLLYSGLGILITLCILAFDKSRLFHDMNELTPA
ncbi:MAG: hypothetical protein JWN30_2789 [Bacilli bacterium]|nr:hypothetical protein [Bacilli bacterium]